MFDAITGKLSLAFSVIASSAIVLFMVLITADVLLRSLFSIPINGVSDIVAYSVVACVFVQLGSTIRDGRLIRAEFLMGGWERRKPLLADGLTAAFYIIATLLLWRATVWLSDDFIKSYTRNEFTGAVGAFQLTLWPFKLAVMAGAGFATFEAARVAVLRLVAVKRAFSASSGAQARAGLLGLVAILAAAAVFVIWMIEGGLSPVTIGGFAFIGLFLLVASGMPVAFALMVMSFLGIWLTRDNITVATNLLGTASAATVRSFEFGVVPLFVMMGLILDRADVGRDAFQVAVVALRRVRGGLGVATVAANAIFAAITGSSIASAAVFSRIAAPAMSEAGYTNRFSAGVIAGSSVLGMLIPPSLLLIIYGLLAETSVGSLFLAAIIPGLMLAFAFGVLNVVMAIWFPKFVGTPKPVDVDGMSGAQMLLRMLPVIFIVSLVMGGIYGGFFSPTEAGAIGAFGAFLVAIARRKLTWRTLQQIVLDTGYITASILFLIIAANLYARMLALTRIPMEATSMIASMNLELTAFVLVYMVLVILLGMILDSVSIMLVVLPIALPVVTALGGDLVWFGVVSVIAIEIGLLTPPFGLSAFVVKGSLPEGFVSLGDIFVGAAPFVLAMLFITLVLIFVPGIVLMIL
jgi:tripartite ATP-independent transporter DctM subunit